MLGVSGDECLSKGVDVDLARKYRDGGAAHTQASAIPIHHQPAIASMDHDRAIQQALAYSRGHSCTCACPAGQRLAHPPLVDPKGHRMPINNLHESCVYSIGKPGMGFD